MIPSNKWKSKGESGCGNNAIGHIGNICTRDCNQCLRDSQIKWREGEDALLVFQF